MDRWTARMISLSVLSAMVPEASFILYVRMPAKKLRKISGSAWRNIKQNECQRFALYDESAFVITTQHVFFFFLSLVKPCHFQWIANNSWISTSCGRIEIPSDSDLRDWVVVNRTNKKDQKKRNMYFLGKELTIFRRRFLLNGRDTSNKYYRFANQSRFYRLRICLYNVYCTTCNLWVSMHLQKI